MIVWYVEFNAYRREIRFLVLKYQELCSISVIPKFCRRASRKGTQVKVTLSVAEEHGAEVDKGHLEYSERLLGKVGPV